ncbi:MAG: ATP-binding protein [Bdellovibrionales bacterium]
MNLWAYSFGAVQSLDEKWTRVDVVCNKAKVEIRVTDSWPGIAQDLHNKRMQPFFTTKEVGKGTDLGLSISHGLVLSHNGTLSIDQKNPNTCFLIKLPVFPSSKISF